MRGRRGKTSYPLIFDKPSRLISIGSKQAKQLNYGQQSAVSRLLNQGKNPIRAAEMLKLDREAVVSLIQKWKRKAKAEAERKKAKVLSEFRSLM